MDLLPSHWPDHNKSPQEQFFKKSIKIGTNTANMEVMVYKALPALREHCKIQKRPCLKDAFFLIHGFQKLKTRVTQFAKNNKYVMSVSYNGYHVTSTLLY